MMAPGMSAGSAWPVLEVLGTALCYSIGPVIADAKLAGTDSLAAIAFCLGPGGAGLRPGRRGDLAAGDAVSQRALWARGLRPRSEPCYPAKGRAVAVTGHPPGDETQWDWVELPGPPAAWGWGSKACLLVGALAHSRRWRGWLSASVDQPHLAGSLDQVTRALGGLTAA